MPNPIWRQLRNTYSLFWKIYETVTALLLLVIMLAITATVWNVAATAFGMKVFLENKAHWIGVTLNISVMIIMFGDLIKYALTRSPRDLPIRKWFSFRWAQKFKPNEVFMVPRGYEGDGSDLVKVRCPQCGALHGFDPEQILLRQCTVYGCRETVSAEQSGAADAQGDIEEEGKAATAVTAAVPRMPAFGDVVDEVESGPAQWVLRHAWDIAEHIFKLTAWMIGATAVIAFAKRTESSAIAVFAIVLSILWLAALASLFFKTTGYLQDFAIAQWVRGKFRHPLAESLVGLVVTGLVVLPSIHLFEVFIEVFIEIFTSGVLTK